MGRLFGTDGVRGRYGRDLTDDLARALGRAATTVLRRHGEREISFVTSAVGHWSGVMISASHNPPEDNGIKFFDAAGFKLSDDVEDEIEAEIAAPHDEPAERGRVLDMPPETPDYVD